MAETLQEFLTRVHRDDVLSGKDVMHKEGQCAVCDEARNEKESA